MEMQRGVTEDLLLIPLPEKDRPGFPLPYFLFQPFENLFLLITEQVVQVDETLVAGGVE